jgi:hypothetical protein
MATVSAKLVGLETETLGVENSLLIDVRVKYLDNYASITAEHLH